MQRPTATSFKRAGKSFFADGCTGLAQQIAFSSLLAFFPAVIALVGLLDVLHVYSALDDFLKPVAPSMVVSLIETSKTDTGGSGSVLALVLGAAGAIWASGGAMGSIVKAINRTEEVAETRPFWKLRILSTVLVLATAFVLVVTLLLVVLGGTIGDAIDHRTGLDWAGVVWNVARWPVAFVAVLFLFSMIYAHAPNARRSVFRLTPGALVGGILWLALSGLFSLYTALSSSYSKTYGALAGAIVLLLWVNYSAWAILFGAELNRALRAEHGTEPLGERADDRGA